MNTEHRPLSEVRKTLRVKWYRCPIPGQRLRELSRRSDLQGWFQSLGHLVLFAGTGVLTYYLFTQQQWVGFGLALFAHGTVTTFLGLAVHELGHGTVFKTKWLNKLFLWVYSILAWHNHADYAMSHTYHHRYTLHPEGDREVELPKSPTLKALYVFQLVTFNLTGGFESNGFIPVMKKNITTALGIFPGDKAASTVSTSSVFSEEWIEALYEDYPEERRKAVNWARVIVLFHLSVIAAAFVFELWLLPLLASFSFFIANLWRYLVGVPMHCGLRDNFPDFRLCTRTITLDPLSSFLYWRMNWHMEHHMYAGVPCYNLSKLSREIAPDTPEPRTLIGAWREMRETWRRQKVDPSYQYDTPLPESAGRVASADQGALNASIGDLAPDVLSNREESRADI